MSLIAAAICGQTCAMPWATPMVAAAAGVGIIGDCGDGEHHREAANAPTESVTNMGSRTQNRLSPTPFSRRFLSGVKPPNQAIL